MIIYATGRWNTERGLRILTAHPEVGVEVEVLWRDFEPQPGALTLDPFSAAGLDRHTILRARAGAAAPDWIACYAPRLPWGRDGRPPYVPVIWDGGYLERWYQAVHWLGAHFSPPLVSMAGPTAWWNEMHLPPDVHWEIAGYSLEHLRAAWRQTLREYLGVFPTSIPTIAINPIGGGAGPTKLILNELLNTARNVGRTLAVQVNWFGDGAYEGAQAELLAFLAGLARDGGVPTGVQLGQLTDHPDALRRALIKAEALGVSWCEVPVAKIGGI